MFHPYHLYSGDVSSVSFVSCVSDVISPSFKFFMNVLKSVHISVVAVFFFPASERARYLFLQLNDCATSGWIQTTDLTHVLTTPLFYLHLARFKPPALHMIEESTNHFATHTPISKLQPMLLKYHLLFCRK